MLTATAAVSIVDAPFEHPLPVGPAAVGVNESVVRSGIAPGSEVVELPVDGLTDHPLNEELFGADSEEVQRALDDSVNALGIQVPVLVTGPGCGVPPGVIISGHRRVRSARRRGLSSVPAILLADLSADAIKLRLIDANLANLPTRKLTRSQIYKIEMQRAALVGRGQGCRTDLHGGAKGEATAIVAEQSGATANAVKTRKAIFGSDVAPESLKRAVDDGTVSPAKAAAKIRAVESLVKSGALSAEDATRGLDEWVSIGAPHERPKTTPKSQPHAGIPADVGGARVPRREGDGSQNSSSPLGTKRADSNQSANQPAAPSVINSPPAVLNQFLAQLSAEDRTLLRELAFNGFKALEKVIKKHLPPGVNFPTTNVEAAAMKQRADLPIAPMFWDALNGCYEAACALEKSGEILATADEGPKPASGKREAASTEAAAKKAPASIASNTTAVKQISATATVRATKPARGTK